VKLLEVFRLSGFFEAHQSLRYAIYRRLVTALSFDQITEIVTLNALVIGIVFGRRVTLLSKSQFREDEGLPFRRVSARLIWTSIPGMMAASDATLAARCMIVSHVEQIALRFPRVGVFGV
jgi:hypothetical protein